MLVYRTAGARPQDARIRRRPGRARGRPVPDGAGSAGEIVVRAADMSRDGGDDGSGASLPSTRDREMADDLYRGRRWPWPRLPGRPLPRLREPRHGAGSAAAGIWVHDMTGETPPRRIFDRKGEPFWANDGRQVIIGVPVGERGSEVRDLAQSTPTARAGPSCRSPMATSPSIAPATGPGWPRGPSAANRTIEGGSPWSTPTAPAPGT